MNYEADLGSAVQQCPIALDSDAKLFRFPHMMTPRHGKPIEQTVRLTVILYAMTLMWRHCNVVDKTLSFVWLQTIQCDYNQYQMC